MRIGEEMKNEPKCLDSCRCWCGDLIISRTHDEDDYTYGHMFVSKFHAPGCPNAEVPKVEWGTDPSEEMGPNEVIAPCGCRAERSGDGKLWSPIGHTCQPAPAPKPKQGGVDFKAAENWAKINAEVPDFSNDCNMARAYLALRAELAANQHDCPNAPAAPMVDVGPGSEWQREAEDNGHRLAAPAPEQRMDSCELCVGVGNTSTQTMKGSRRRPKTMPRSNPKPPTLAHYAGKQSADFWKRVHATDDINVYREACRLQELELKVLAALPDAKGGKR